MTIDATIQLSFGRFPVSLEEADTIKQVKTKIRQTYQNIAHVNLDEFRVNVGGNYLSDESKTVAEVAIQSGDVLHFVKKAACPAAALDTEKKSDDE